MPSRSRVFLAAACAAVCMVLFLQPASANSATLVLPPEGTYIDTTRSLDVSLSVTPSVWTDGVSPRVRVVPYDWSPFYTDGYDAGETYTFSHTIPAVNLAESCISGGGYLNIHLEVVVRSGSVDALERTYPCGSGPQVIEVVPLDDYFVATAVCGSQNDRVSYSQPNVITHENPVWVGNQLVFTIEAASGYIFPGGLMTTTIAYTDNDTNCQIEPSLVLDPIHTDVCGSSSNDTFAIPQPVPEGMSSELSVAWSGSTATITYHALDGWEFSPGVTTQTFERVDERNLCDSPNTTLTLNFGTDLFVGMDPDGGIEFSASHIHQPNADHTSRSFSFTLDGEGVLNSGMLSFLQNGYTITWIVPVSAVQEACADGFIDLEVSSVMDFRDHESSIKTDGMDQMPCSYIQQNIIITDALNPPTIVEFCGANNDSVNHALSQPEGVRMVPTRTDYDANNVYTLTYATLPGYEFAEEYDFTLTHTDPEPDVPCILVTPDGELEITQVCGYISTAQANDVINLVPQEGVKVDNARWLNSLYRINIVPEPGYAFPEGAVTEFDRWDSATLCEEPTLDLADDTGELVDIAPGEPVVFTATLTLPQDNPFDDANLLLDSDFSTSESDTVFVPVLGDGGDKLIGFQAVTGEDFYEACAAANGQFEIDVTVELTGPNGVERTLTDSGTFACDPLQPIVPDASLLQQVHVCGNNNDTVSTTQEGVIVTLGDWSDNAATATFSAAEGYTFTGDAPAPEEIIDEGPCIVDYVEPSGPEAVCGPNNDVYTSPDQPEGVVETDSGWNNNQRTITFSPADGYAFPGGENVTHSYTDADIACEVDPEGKHVIVTLNTSDGGSIEGTTYQLFAPEASQEALAPYAEGLVGPHNQIVFSNLIAGEYRLMVEAEGYEPVDEILAVTDGTEPQEITVEVAQVVEVETPTPEPTASPTSTASPEATASPTSSASPTATESPTVTVSPTSTSTAVTALPETGAGAGASQGVIMLAALAAAAMVLTAVGSRKFR